MSINRILWLIIGVQFLLVYILSSSSFTLANDMIENLLWGRNLDFSSDKHPPFFGWVSYLSVKLGGGSFIFYKMLTPIHQAFLFLFTFLLAKEILGNEKKALLSVIFCSGIIVHIFYTKFNANSANFGLFSAIYYLFYLTVARGKAWLFPILGVLCGVVMLIKYSAIILIGCLWLTIFITKEGRALFKSPFLYLGILAFLLVLTPYVINLLQSSNYGAFAYLSENSSSLKMRWYELPRLILMTFVFCIPFLIAFFKVKDGKFLPKFNFDGIFLLLNAFLPFIATFIYIIVANAQVGVFWLCMFFTLFPICALYFFNTKEDALKISAKVIFPLMFVIYIFHILPQLFAPERDVKQIGSFVKEVAGDANYFICNDDRNICGTAIIFGTPNFANVKMTVSKWINPFLEVNSSLEKPKKIVIIGKNEEINLPNYELKEYEKEFPNYFKFKFLENKLKKKSAKITLTVGSLKEGD
jgi:4-amino-4-deoxy-L-arabinose transferase-like glycosyltransferase